MEDESLRAAAWMIYDYSIPRHIRHGQADAVFNQSPGLVSRSVLRGPQRATSFLLL